MYRSLRRPGLKQQDSGQTVAQISREHSISKATFYGWNGAARSVIFQCFKERGFALTTAHLKALEKLKKLLALVSLAHGFYLVAGRHIDRKIKQIGRKKHGYKGQSYFRRGKDILEAYLTGKPLDVVVDCGDVFRRLQRWLWYQIAYFCPQLAIFR